jgi:inosine-uridine nucleoside N-ribohydrolase
MAPSDALVYATNSFKLPSGATVSPLFARKDAGSMASDELQRVIIDTDPGVDDAQAILLGLRLGAFQIDAVTTVFGNCAVTTATRNARTLLELGEADHVPVFMGAGEPLIRRPRPFATMVHEMTASVISRPP